MKQKKPRLWSVSRITDRKHPGITVRIGEYKADGTLHLFHWINGRQTSRALALRRTDLGATVKAQKERAWKLGCEYIEEIAAQRCHQTPPSFLRGTLSLGALPDKYAVDGFARCTSAYKRDAVASVRRVAAFIGENVPVRDIKPSSLEKYMAHRIKQGHAPAGRSDLVALTIAINWAVGEGLLTNNPISTSKRSRDAMRISHQVSRPVATAERYKRLKAVASELPPAFNVLLDLAWHTGHRIGAILTLRWEDVSFEQTTHAPFGTIRWYAGVVSDRKKHDHTLPMNEQARNALLAFRKLNFPPKGWLFGAQEDRTQQMPKWGPKKWLGKAERLAGLPHLKMGGWHIFRRGWASARKHMPLKDVARAGGWSETDTTTLTKCYQHSDQDTTLQVATFVA